MRTLRPAALLALTLVVILATACTAAEPTATVAPTPEPTPSSTPSPTPIPTPTPVPTPVPTPTPTPFDQALLEQRITILFAGLDANDDRRTRTGIFNTDAMVVASVDPTHTRVATVALPRDTVDMVLADGRRFSGKVNSIYSTFGVEALRGALAATYGIDIDYYVVLDMADFGRMITALGGVQVDVQQRLFDSGIGLDLQPGTQVLDGNDALRYVRTRVDTDYGRNARQQQMVIAVARELLDPAAGVDLVSFAMSLGSVETDIPPESIPTLLEIARRAAGAEVTSLVLQPPRFALFEGIEQGGRGWVMVPNVAEIRAYVQSVMAGQ